MQRHVNDWVGTLKAAIPYLELLEADNIHDPNVGLRRDEKLTDVLQEAKDIVEAAEASIKMGPKQPQTLVQELTQVINRRSLENGSNTPDFILADFLSRCLVAFDDTTNARATWYGKKDTAFNKAAGATITPEENKAAQLCAIHKTPYGANLGKNGPEIVPGLRFKTTHSPELVFEVKSVNTCFNEVAIGYKGESGTPYSDTWDLDETRERFERGQYWQVFTKEEINKAGEAVADYYNTRSHWEAEALKKRQFPAGGVVSEMRKQAGREIMADIENKTAETLHGYRKTVEYVPAGLWEEFNRTNAQLAELWANGKTSTQEYKDLQNQANELAACMNKVKKEGIRKEAADDFNRMVADAMKVTEAFVQAAKAASQYSKASREARAEMDKVPVKNPITDAKGFLFLRGNEVGWLFHDGRRYLSCKWEGPEWVGWEVTEERAHEAAKTQLPDYLDQFVRSIMPTK